MENIAVWIIGLIILVLLILLLCCSKRRQCQDGEYDVTEIYEARCPKKTRTTSKTVTNSAKTATTRAESCKEKTVSSHKDPTVTQTKTASGHFASSSTPSTASSSEVIVEKSESKSTATIYGTGPAY